ncbi:DUF1285 domain-containing protein [Bacterioplanes sanyensis]|nr:DUF1285 domain-containing protein [Bacterioplanes sanyensis]
MDLSNLQQQIGLQATAKQPPLEQWQPELSGDIDIEIHSDGGWWHQGSAFERQDLVRLFASILRREGDEYFLVTPVEKWRIQVEDRPFVVTLIEADADGIEFVTNVGDSGRIGPEHPLRLSYRQGEAEPLPEVLIRHDLWARLSRNAFYELVEHAVEIDGQWRILSDGESFALVVAE